MDMEKSYEYLVESETYKDFVKNEEDFYLVHASIIREVATPGKWEFGYYNKKKDRIVVFETEPIFRVPEQEAFKAKGTIKKLTLSKVKINYVKAMEIAEKVRLEKYNSELVMKYIAILQNLQKQLWNVTLITRSFSIINIKINATTGEILSDNKHSILDLGIRQA